VTFTRVRVLVGIGAAVLLITWAFLRGARTILLGMPWSVPVVLATVAAGIVVSAVGLRRRLRG
jgi:hypothetical protein